MRIREDFIDRTTSATKPVIESEYEALRVRVALPVVVSGMMKR